MQEKIREFYKDTDWQELADKLGIGVKSVQYQLNADLGREVTYHFVGLLAVKDPESWKVIWFR